MLSSINRRVKESTGKADVIFIGDSITQGWEGEGSEFWRAHFDGRGASLRPDDVAAVRAIYPSAQGTRFGIAIAGTPDLNGDGLMDIVMQSSVLRPAGASLRILHQGPVGEFTQHVAAGKCRLLATTGAAASRSIFMSR